MAKLFKILKNGLSIFYTIIGVIVNLFGLLQVAYCLYLIYFHLVIKNKINNENIPNDINGFIYSNPLISVLLVIATLIGTFVIIVYLGHKKTLTATSSRNQALNLIHRNFLHSLRNHISHFDTVEIQVFDKKENEIREIILREYEYLRNSIQPYVDSLSDYYFETSGARISVCIKTFTLDSNDEDIDNKTLMTLVRCKNTERSRKKPISKHAVVGMNTDFETLCKEAGAYYGETNLYKKLKKGVYKTDTDSVRKRYYNSTLVAPIRHISISIDKNSSIDIKPRILGFLCIDSKQNMNIWKNEESFALELLGIFADALYIYLNKYYKCFGFN